MLKEKSRPGTQSRATERTQEQEKEEVGLNWHLRTQTRMHVLM